jgi:hypothetical protein
LSELRKRATELLDHPIKELCRTARVDRRLIEVLVFLDPHQGRPQVASTAINISAIVEHWRKEGALGADLRGTRFTREEVRTLAVWARGDDPPLVVTGPASGGGSGIDACGLLLCLLRDDGIQRLLERNEVDPDALGRRVNHACR